MSDTTDILIIGGGIIGMAVALELQMRDPSARITVLEKEPVPAVHQSVRNSGHPCGRLLCARQHEGPLLP